MSQKKDPKNFKPSELGYPHIEKLIEFEKFDDINKSFAEAYDKLEIIYNDAGSPLKKKKSAEKAMKSYELTTQLINELLVLKKELVKEKEKAKK